MTATDVVDIWTDGACVGNPGPMGIGALVMWGGERHEISEHIGMGTNNIAELTAIDRALDLAFKKRGCNLGSFIIHTDSKYAIGVLSEGWKAKANGALIGRIRRRLPRSVAFIWVRGHSGVPENERCDELATAAALGKQAPEVGATPERVAIPKTMEAALEWVQYHRGLGPVSEAEALLALLAQYRKDTIAEYKQINPVLVRASRRRGQG